MPVLVPEAATYAGLAVLSPGESVCVYEPYVRRNDRIKIDTVQKGHDAAAAVTLVRKDGTERWTDGHQTNARRLPLDAASVITLVQLSM